MIFRSIIKKPLFTLVSTLILAPVFSSCINEDFGQAIEQDDRDVIRVSAGISPMEGFTRTYYGSDQVENVSTGTLYITYPRLGNQASSYTIYDLAYVDFGSPEAPETGFAYYFNDQNVQKDLSWKKIWNEGKTTKTFYLHNVNPEWWSYAYTSNRYDYYQKYSFNELAPYTAAPLDKINGTNDIISGSTSATNTTSNISFTLYHRLSLLKVNVEAYSSESDGHIINLDNAQVTISNLYRKLLSFNPYYPSSFSTSTSYQYNTISDRGLVTFIDPEDESLSWEPKIESQYESEDGEMYTKIIYPTTEFVVPPQPSFSASYWPVLTVTIPKEDYTGSMADQGDYVTFSGKIPDWMFNVNSDGTLNPSPLALAVSSGYQLTITATINSPETELSFAPVRVEAWVNKGTFTLTSKQSGIYTMDDWNAMVEAYKAGDLQTLQQYGYLDVNGQLVLQFWGGLTFNKEDIEGCMSVENNPGVDIPFSFMFNDYTEKVTDEDGNSRELTGPEGQFTLYNIVTGNDLEFTGIRNAQDLLNVIAICNQEEPDLMALRQYGIVSNIDNTITFNIEGSFDVDIEDVFQKIPQQIWYYTLFLNISPGNTVNVTLPDTNEPIIECSNNPSYDKLSKLVVKQANVGITSSQDFYFLTAAYNQYYQYFNDILTLWGTVNTSGTWTFTFRNAMTLNGDDTYMSMVPDPENNRPNYTCTYISGANITIENDLFGTVSVTAGNISSFLTPMLSGTGKARGNTSLSSIVTYYNNNNYFYLWYYGRYENGEWIFPLTYSSSSQYCAYSSLFGKMIPDDEAGRYGYSFDLNGITYFYVTSMPNSPETTTTSNHYFNQDGTYGSYTYPRSAADLKKVALGTYWEDFPTD